MVPKNSQLPLCVDLDGTLINADLSIESLFGALRKVPWMVMLMPFWLLRGRSFLKGALARFADIDASTLPYHHGVLSLVQKRRGVKDDTPYLSPEATASMRRT